MQLMHPTPLVEERPADWRRHFGSRFVMTKVNPMRSLWTVIVTLLLVYTGTVFLYRLCYIEFRIQFEDSEVTASAGTDSSDAVDWNTFDNFVSAVFWVDLGLNFFFSYYEEEDRYEVDDLCLIAKHYLKFQFWINLIACIPEAVIQWLINNYVDDGAPQQLNQSVRALRLQRISRLARLTRLTRLAKLRQQSKSAWYLWFERQKGVRVINLMCGLLWVMHAVACGWYLCASLHDTPADTWVMRRITASDGSSTLVDSPPFDQWMHSMYFVLTVFTTVGFGDISGTTIGEITYVCFAMGVGAVVHSIIISEVINVVVSSDDVNVFVKKQSDLVQAFAEHTELGSDISRQLRRWVDATAKQWVAQKYDRNEVKEIITGKFLPRELLEQLPSALFSGMLLRNNFLWVCRGVCNMPPRLPVLLALALSKSTFSAMEVIYQVYDYSFNMFLVASGTFAYVARPSLHGGMPHVRGELSRSEVSWRTIGKSRKTAFSKVVGTFAAGMSRKCSEAEDHAEATLFPYCLFGVNSWFGDDGLARAAPRAHTARCESDHGEVLALSKVSMKDLGDQFPQFGVRWAALARHHERRHQEQLSQLTFGCTYRHFAAVRIQTWYREFTSVAMRVNRDRTRRALSKVSDEDNMVYASKARKDRSLHSMAEMKRDLQRLTSTVVDLADKQDHMMCAVTGLADKVDTMLLHLVTLKL